MQARYIVKSNERKSASVIPIFILIKRSYVNVCFAYVSIFAGQYWDETWIKHRYEKKEGLNHNELFDLICRSRMLKLVHYVC